MSVLSGGGNALSPFGLAGQGIQDTINIGFGAYDRYESKRIADENLQYQKDVLAYQKDLQQQIFAREDNAVSRRAADLEAAGLSKTLAAGSGAGAGHAVGVSAPQRERPSPMSDILANVGGIAAAADISHTVAQSRHLQMQDKALASTVALQDKQREMMDIDIKTRAELNRQSIEEIKANIRKVDEQIQNILMDTLNKSAANRRMQAESNMAELDYLMELRESLMDIAVGGRRGKGGNFTGLQGNLGAGLDYLVRQWGGDQYAIDRYVLHSLGMGPPAGEVNRGGTQQSAFDPILRELARRTGQTAAKPRGSNSTRQSSGRGRSRGTY